MSASERPVARSIKGTSLIEHLQKQSFSYLFDEANLRSEDKTALWRNSQVGLGPRDARSALGDVGRASMASSTCWLCNETKVGPDVARRFYIPSNAMGDVTSSREVQTVILLVAGRGGISDLQ